VREGQESSSSRRSAPGSAWPARGVKERHLQTYWPETTCSSPALRSDLGEPDLQCDRHAEPGRPDRRGAAGPGQAEPAPRFGPGTSAGADPGPAPSPAPAQRMTGVVGRARRGRTTGGLGWGRRKLRSCSCSWARCSWRSDLGTPPAHRRRLRPRGSRKPGRLGLPALPTSSLSIGPRPARRSRRASDYESLYVYPGRFQRLADVKDALTLRLTVAHGARTRLRGRSTPTTSSSSTR